MASSSSSHAPLDSTLDDISFDDVYAQELFSIMGKKGRRRCREVQTLPPGQKIALQFNGVFQPIGTKATTFTDYLGFLSRWNRYCPLDIDDWRNMDDAYKDRLYKIVEGKFSFTIPPIEFRRFTLMDIGRKWKNYKCILKKSFDPKLSNAVNFTKRPAGVEPRQWERLVVLYRSKMPLAEKNRENRKKQTLHHTTGRMSYARKRQLLEVDGPVGPLTFFEATHLPKSSETLVGDAFTVAVNTRQIVEEKVGESVVSSADLFAIEEDALREVIGPERRGTVRGQGLGVNRNRLEAYRKSQAEALELQDLKTQVKTLSTELALSEAKRMKREEELSQELAEIKRMLISVYKGSS